jgi:ABC-type multidrug transport system fused ATPase/permease subunit
MKNFIKMFQLLDLNEKKQALFLLILTLIMAILDTLGIASILPFISVVSNPQIIETNEYLLSVYKTSIDMGVTSKQQFLFIFGAVVFILLLFSLFFKVITIYFQTRFALMREYSIGKRLLEFYLHQPYIWFLHRNSSDLSKIILSEVNQVVINILIPMINLITQSILAFAILSLLILFNPILAFFAGLILIMSYLVIFYFVKNILFQFGHIRFQANSERFLIISEVFGATKDVKVRGLEQEYINRFSKPAEIYAKNQSSAYVIGQTPRYFLEAIAFGGLIILVLVLMLLGGSFEKIVPIIALYAFAGYRLMPALQQIYASSTQLRFSQSALYLLHKDLINLQQSKQITNNINIISINKSVELNDISFNYPNSKKFYLKNINLIIPAFTKVGIVGVTGSGKTTLVDLILGLLDPTKGTLSVDGIEIKNDNKRSWQRSIGYVPQQIYLSDASVANNIAFGIDIKNIDQQSLEKASKIANLHDFVKNELPYGYNTIIGERGIRLSGGQRQRIGIARALYHNPQIFILDEATNALDNITEQAIMDAINNLGNKITVILITHRLKTIKNCDKIFFMQKGLLIKSGNYNELLENCQQFRKMALGN